MGLARLLLVMILGLLGSGCRAPLELQPLPTRAPELDLEPDSITRSDPGTHPRLLLNPNPAVEPLPVDTQVSVRVLGPAAHVRVRQQFRNPYNRTIAVIYELDLPEGAQLDALAIRVGERTITSEVRLRDLDAPRPEPTRRIRYELARVPAFAQVDVELGYLQAVPIVDGEYALTIPLEPRPQPGAALRVDVDVEAGASIERWTSPHAKLDATPTERGFRATLAEPEGAREFELRWRARPTEVRATLHLDETGEDSGYFTLLLTAPKRRSARAPVELIFVVDSSPSMKGHRLSAARLFIKASLARLSPGDRFNIVTLAHTALFADPQPITKRSLVIAERFLDKLDARSGSSLRRAIATALRPEVSTDVSRIIVVLSAGAIGRVSDLIAASEDLVARADAVGGRAHVFGVGVGVGDGSVPALIELARAGKTEPLWVDGWGYRGAGVDRVFRYIDRPLVGTPTLEWSGVRLEQIYPLTVPDLLAGETLVVHGRYHGTSTHAPSVRSLDPGAMEPVELPVERVLASRGDRLITTGWARAVIADLLEQRDHEQFTRVGLDHQLVTPLTSLFALDSAGQARVLLELPEDPIRLAGRSGWSYDCMLDLPMSSGFVYPIEEAETLPLGDAVWAPESVVRIARLAASEGVDRAAVQRALRERKAVFQACHEVYASKAMRRRLRYRLHFDGPDRLLAVENLDGSLSETGNRCLEGVFSGVAWDGLPNARSIIELDLRLRLR